MAHRTRFASPVALVLLLVGCTGGSGGSDNTGGGGATGGTGSTSTCSLVDGCEPWTSIPPDAGGDTPSATCAPFLDEPGEGGVSFRVHNETGQTIYLPTGGCAKVGPGRAFLLERASGEDGVVWGYENNCFQSCATLQATQRWLGCDCFPSLLVLPAGESADIGWNGTGVGAPVSMPAACWAASDPVGTCGRRISAPADDYAVTVTAYPQVSSFSDCDTSGVCSPAFPQGTPAVSAPVTFTFPGAPIVDVVFDACAFGCPDPGGP